MTKRSGSNKRNRNRQINVRLTETEYSVLERMAQKTGVSMAKFLRLAALGGKV